jgi:hypothetical protein
MSMIKNEENSNTLSSTASNDIHTDSCSTQNHDNSDLADHALKTYHSILSQGEFALDVETAFTDSQLTPEQIENLLEDNLFGDNFKKNIESLGVNDSIANHRSLNGSFIINGISGNATHTVTKTEDGYTLELKAEQGFEAGKDLKTDLTETNLNSSAHHTSKIHFKFKSQEDLSNIKNLSSKEQHQLFELIDTPSSGLVSLLSSDEAPGQSGFMSHLNSVELGMDLSAHASFNLQSQSNQKNLQPLAKFKDAFSAQIEFSGNASYRSTAGVQIQDNGQKQIIISDTFSGDYSAGLAAKLNINKQGSDILNVNQSSQLKGSLEFKQKFDIPNSVNTNQSPKKILDEIFDKVGRSYELQINLIMDEEKPSQNSKSVHDVHTTRYSQTFTKDDLMKQFKGQNNKSESKNIFENYLNQAEKSESDASIYKKSSDYKLDLKIINGAYKNETTVMDSH